MTPSDFFKTIFGSAQGFVCVATISGQKNFKESFYRYPEQLGELNVFVETQKYAANVYFCPQLLSEPRRSKICVARTTCAWADLDSCPPSVLLVPPTIALESSPGRYQAFWVFDGTINPTDLEDLSRRIAYRHADEGADRSGWDLTQLLRVPETRNFKYGAGPLAPIVRVVVDSGSRYRLEDFHEYPAAAGYEYTQIPFPKLIIEDGIKILERFSFRISSAAHTLFHQEVEEGKRSQQLFRLEMLCAEAGMTREEAFQTARDAACNKWPDEPELLWRDVCRAFAQHADTIEAAGKVTSHDGPELVTDQERRDIETNPTFVERYVDWAKTIGDAAEQYHEACAFVALSSMLAGVLRLPTSFGSVIPNLWVMILADTTLTRKSTAMNAVMDLLEEVDESLLMATDGSIEGFAQALSERPGQVSIFYRDEFTGLMESMTKKDYMAGMPEFFTNLYDGRTQVRRLRKEEIKIKDPRLIMLAGGIKNRMQSLVTFEHVSSGFLPRFIFVTAESDASRIKDLGPPEEQDSAARTALLHELQDLYTNYRVQVPIKVGVQQTSTTFEVRDASLTRNAWRRFNQIEHAQMQAGVEERDLRDIIVPLYARLDISILKAAVLISASRTMDRNVTVDEEDIVRAAYYGEKWRHYALEVVRDIGKSPLEHKIQLVLNAIQRRERMGRSTLMQTYHLTAQEMSTIVRTLEERGQINMTKHGKQEIYQSLLTHDEKVLRSV